MSSVIVEEEHLKSLLKQAILELLQERQDVLYDLFAEIVEDLALVNAIREGEATGGISRTDVLQVLEGVG